MMAPCSLAEALASGLPVVCDTGRHAYLIGGAASDGGNMVVVALGWDDPNGGSGHPFHFLPCVVETDGPGPWIGGPVTLSIADEDHPLFWSWLNWRDAVGNGWRVSIEKGNAACVDLLAHP